MAENLADIFESTEPVLLTSGWGRAEGPLWHPEGYVTFVDLEGNRLLHWDPNGSVTVVRENTGEGNGCTLDRQGRLIMCEGADHRRITRMEKDGTVTAIAERWQGKRFNKPNDVVCRSDGSIYFTDPELRLPAELREIGFAGVYRIDPAGNVHLATDECEYPNGLAFSPDESVLYVAISRLDGRCFEEAERGEVCTHRRIRAFDVAPDGTLSDNRVFCVMSSAEPGVPDGLKVDTKGRVFCVGSGGIWVIAPSGEVIGIVKMSEVVRNLAFGGSDFRTLYLTPRGSLMKLEVKTPGIGAFS
ncbi:MAG: SMP-30/gluconolactonase/LRE family protein [Deltaproteobacteria bacterium]|nr:SMP-30/gluconolactonase/LRE family protein [Deltaproteobacteria bacterium]